MWQECAWNTANGTKYIYINKENKCISDIHMIEKRGEKRKDRGQRKKLERRQKREER